jgi:hypothetical protein
MTIQQEVALVVARAGVDDAFAARLRDDPVAALLEVGCVALSRAVRSERERIRQLATRLDEDGRFRGLVEDDPTVIVESGIPREALEPVLRALGASDELIARAQDSTTLDALASLLGACAFADEALAGAGSALTGLGPVRRPRALSAPP